jgi:hypothetical protein
MWNGNLEKRSIRLTLIGIIYFFGFSLLGSKEKTKINFFQKEKKAFARFYSGRPSAFTQVVVCALLLGTISYYTHTHTWAVFFYVLRNLEEEMVGTVYTHFFLCVSFL